MNTAEHTHLCFCLSIYSNHILSAGRPHKGASLFVPLYQVVDGLLQSRWTHCTSLCICCVYDSAVCNLQDHKKKISERGISNRKSLSLL